MQLEFTIEELEGALGDGPPLLPPEPEGELAPEHTSTERNSGSTPQAQAQTKSPRGRKALPLEAAYARELEPVDLDRPSDNPPVELKSLRTRHHELARIIAEGELTMKEVAIKTGYSQVRISVLMGDPAFSELVEQYKGEVNQIYLDAHQRLTDVMNEATEILLERLDEDPDGFTNNQLLEVLKNAADRVGHGPTSTQKVEGAIVHATPDLISKIKEKVNGRQHGQTKQITQEKEIEAEYTTVEEDGTVTSKRDDEQLQLPNCGGPGLRDAPIGGSSGLPQEAEVQRSKGQGSHVRTSSGKEATSKDQ